MNIIQRIFGKNTLFPADSIFTEKVRIRTEIGQKKTSFSDTQKELEARVVFSKIEEMPLFQKANTLLMYWSLPDELPTKDFIEKWSKSKTILLPVVTEGNLKLKKYTGTGEMKTGAYGIFEPIGTSDYYDKIDIALVPGVAFDEEGRRIGRGKGYYDRFLKNKNILKWGVCFSFQLYKNLPSATFDIKMDKVFAP